MGDSTPWHILAIRKSKYFTVLLVPKWIFVVKTVGRVCFVFLSKKENKGKNYSIFYNVN